MREWLSGHLTYANVVSTVCLFIVLGGSSYAAITITGKSVKNNSLTGADIKNGSLLKADFKAGQLPRSARGLQGPPGPPGATGAHGADAPLPPPEGAPVQQRLTIEGLGTFPVETSSWAGSFDPPPHTGGGTGGPTDLDELAVLSVPSSLSPQLLDAIARSTEFDSATLELGAPGSPAGVFDFDHVMLTGLDAGSGAGPRREDLSLHVELGGLSPLTFHAGAPALPVHEEKVGEAQATGIPGVVMSLYTDGWGLFGNAGGVATHPTFTDFTVVKGFDAASPALLHAMLAETHIGDVTIRLFRPGTTTVESTFVLSDVLVPSYHEAVSLSALEQVSFYYDKVQQTTDGVTRCYDLTQNAFCTP
jgi:hypothetical protein